MTRSPGGLDRSLFDNDRGYESDWLPAPDSSVHAGSWSRDQEAARGGSRTAKVVPRHARASGSKITLHVVMFFTRQERSMS
jgi:hypothetical protein